MFSSMQHCQHGWSRQPFIYELWSAHYFSAASIDSKVIPYFSCAKECEVVRKGKRAWNLPLLRARTFQPDSLLKELHMQTAFPTFLGSMKSGIYTVGFKLNGGSIGDTKTFDCFIFTSNITYPVFFKYYVFESF